MRINILGLKIKHGNLLQRDEQGNAVCLILLYTRWCTRSRTGQKRQMIIYSLFWISLNLSTIFILKIYDKKMTNKFNS